MKDSWESVANWYDRLTGEKGHYYHQALIIPKLLELFEIEKTKNPAFLDLACGSGILSSHLPKTLPYLGIDISPSLIAKAKERNPPKNHQFQLFDLGKKLNLPKKDFSHAAIILALQNMENPLQLVQNGYDHLRNGGKIFVVLNHPCFRISRQSSWEIDQKKKLQYRRIDRYFSPLKIPIQIHPGKDEEIHTFSYHHPLSTYGHFFKKAGFLIESIEEWCSPKKSTGKMAKMENFSREEFPLFLTFVAKKKG
ncbi:MAG: methyltransferase domain-containing protein [Chlamydiae bacterium]|nr:methyltransferase domain-containing protein [Chlamydiota bacterium]